MQGCQKKWVTNIYCDTTADKSTMKILEVYSAILSAHIQSNALSFLINYWKQNLKEATVKVWNPKGQNQYGFLCVPDFRQYLKPTCLYFCNYVSPSNYFWASDNHVISVGITPTPNGRKLKSFCLGMMEKSEITVKIPDSI